VLVDVRVQVISCLSCGDEGYSPKQTTKVEELGDVLDHEIIHLNVDGPSIVSQCVMDTPILSLGHLKTTGAIEFWDLFVKP
jgi:hypothetical protein